MSLYSVSRVSQLSCKARGCLQSCCSQPCSRLKSFTDVRRSGVSSVESNLFLRIVKIPPFLNELFYMLEMCERCCCGRNYALA